MAALCVAAALPVREALIFVPAIREEGTVYDGIDFLNGEKAILAMLLCLGILWRAGSIIPGGLIRRCLEYGGEMHVVLHLIPGNNAADAVRAEDGVRGILTVLHRAVALCSDDLLCIVAGKVAEKAQLQLPLSAGVAAERVCVVQALRHGKTTRDDCVFHRGIRSSDIPLLSDREFRLHAVKIRESSSDSLLRNAKRKAVPWLEKNIVRVHQSVSHGAVGSLTEITTLRVFFVCSSGGKRDLHVCDC